MSADADAAAALHVVAGVLTDPQGRVLIAERLPGKPLAGHWEFPGGKVKRGEAAPEALRRELREELGIEVLEASPLVRYRHAAFGGAVLLEAWTVTRHAGEPRGIEGQKLRWEPVGRLLEAGLLEADRPIVEALEAPSRR